MPIPPPADFTERKQVENQRIDALKYQLLFESSRDALMTLGPPSWKFTSANQATLQLFGASSVAEFIAVGPWVVSPERQPDGRLSSEKAQEMIETAMREGSHFFEWEHQRLDGRSFAADVLLTRMDVGEDVFLQATVRDITARKQTEARLKNSEQLAFQNEEKEKRAAELVITNKELKQSALQRQTDEIRLRKVIETSKDAFISMDVKGGIIDWNAQAEKTFGWSRKEVIGKNLAATIIPSSTHKAHAQGVKHYLATGEGPVLDKTIEVNALHHDGHEFPVELSIVSLQLEGITTFNAFLRDITVRKKEAQMLEKSRDQLRVELVATVQVISRAVEARDPYTAGHQLRVSQLARSIAQEMGLDNDRTEGIRLGALVHDVGKIQVPAEILSKPGGLSDIEFLLIKGHATNGYEILKDVDFPWPIADIAHQHHERLDGSGYPQGLKGDAISQEARIVAVADVVEAMSSHRPYRAGLGIDAALAEVEAHKGTHYDPAVVDACLKLFREKGFSFEVR